MKIANILAVLFAVLPLSGCIDTDEMLTEEEKVEATLARATVGPCSAETEFQVELNGVPDRTLSSTEEVDGREIVTDKHWYPDIELIVYYSYSRSEAWCNVWNETGVSWNYPGE